ncbi:hypothetical protein ABIB25_003465 [Nakamurella sp. UYEF19]|uniref:hypothetical protein n=1 Tax=Nakamurella sp. UYEF19 TaxID=1756392 RepID=UPI003390E972
MSGQRGVQKTASTTDRRRTTRLVVALCVVLASAGCIGASTLVWFTVPGGASISGWGHISGGQADGNGQNINDVLAGLTTSTYRPGVLAVVIGVLALLAGLGIALVARGEKPHRIPAALLALCGAGGLTWGLLRALSPGDLAGLYPDACNGSGLGPWLTAASSVVLLAAAVVVFLGLLDPPPPVARRGIQPG